MKSVNGITIGVFVGLLILGMCLMCATHIFKKDDVVYAHTPHTPHEVIRTRDCPVPPPRCEDSILNGLDGIERVQFNGQYFYVIKNTNLTVQRLLGDLGHGCDLEKLGQYFHLNQENFSDITRFLTSLSVKFNDIERNSYKR